MEKMKQRAARGLLLIDGARNTILLTGEELDLTKINTLRVKKHPRRRELDLDITRYLHGLYVNKGVNE